MSEDAARAPKPGSWRLLILALVLFVLAPKMAPALLPIEQVWLMLAGLTAACLLVSWREGGPVLPALLSLGIAALLLSRQAGPAGSAYDWMARGWILLLAGSFGIVSIVGAAQGFFSRALSALALATVLGFGITLSAPAGPGRVSGAITAEFQRRTAKAVFSMRESWETPEWKGIIARAPRLQEASEESVATLTRLPALSATVAPALLALQSLAAMALAWALAQRLGAGLLGPPLGRLREFRFNDQLVWGVAVGASIVLLPQFSPGRNAGLNLLLFFGALYLIRGLAIVTWMARGTLTRIALVTAAVIAFPLMAAVAFGLGLGDTWLDLRSRTAKAA